MIPRGPFQPLPFCDSVRAEGREEGQSPSDPREVTLVFGRLPQRTTDPGALSAGWPTSDKTICWKPHWGNLAGFPAACPDFPTQGVGLARVVCAVWSQNAPYHKLHQREKHWGSQGRLRPTSLAPFLCLNLLGCQFLFFQISFLLLLLLIQCIRHARAQREVCSMLD